MSEIMLTIGDVPEVSLTADMSPGGTSDYERLNNKPKINGVELSGNLSLEALGIIDAVRQAIANEPLYPRSVNNE